MAVPVSQHLSRFLILFCFLSCTDTTYPVNQTRELIWIEMFLIGELFQTFVSSLILSICFLGVFEGKT